MEGDSEKREPPEIVSALAMVVRALDATGHGRLVNVLLGGLRSYLGNERAHYLWGAVVCCVNSDWNDTGEEDKTDGK